MNNRNIDADMAVPDDPAEMDESLANMPEQVIGFIEEANILVDDVVALTYQKDLLNSELAFKQKQLCRLFAAMKREYALLTNSKVVAVEDIACN